MHLYGDEDRHTDVLLEEQMAESIDLATQMVELFGDDENTQETTGGGTPTESFHVGPDVVMMSETEALPPEAIISPPSPPYVDEAPPLCGEQGGIFELPENREVPRVRCPWCSFSSATSGGLVRHISSKHEGSTIDDGTCSLLLGLGKGCCVACGALRASNGNFCSRCRTSIGTRPPVSGDLVRASRIERESNFVEVTQDAPGIWTPLLPDGLIGRLRLISSNTLVHVPVAFRDRLSRIMTKSNGHIVSGDVVGNLCAQSWPKLLLSAPPAGFNLQTELSKRFAL